MNADAIRVLTVERDEDTGVIVTFSDGTTGAYVTEELFDLRLAVNRPRFKEAQAMANKD